MYKSHMCQFSDIESFFIQIKLFTTRWLFTLSERRDKEAKLLLSSETRRAVKWDLKQEMDQTPTSEIGCLYL